MTRETKIGLLVGLAFIIVIGILFSDYMTGVGAPANAPIQLAGNNVRSGLGQPATDNAPPVSVTPPNPTPNQTVLTRDELQPRRAVSQPPITLQGQEMIGNNHGNSTGSNNLSSNLVDVARQHGEELVDGNGQTIGNGNDGTPQGDAPQPVKVTAAGSYKAEPGDSVTKIATKVYGKSTKTLRDAIIAANPSLKDNPNRIIVGHTYVIPPQNGGSAAATAVLPTQSIPAVAQQSTKTTEDPEHVYVVQQGDTLWSIARDEVGNASAVAAIRELNNDVLKGSDRVRPNMKLRLPAKPVASAN